MKRSTGAQGRAVGPLREASCALVAVVLLIALAGCGSGKSASTGAPAQDQTSTTGATAQDQTSTAGAPAQDQTSTTGAHAQAQTSTKGAHAKAQTSTKGAHAKAQASATGSLAHDQTPTTVAGGPADASSGMPAGQPGSPLAMGHEEAKPVTHRVELNDKVCVQFDPQWTRLRLGETVTWHSNLKKTVEIYVSPGVFSHDHFVIHPGATVHTSPVQHEGDWAFWTEPAACHEAPRGILAAGPGVFVEPTFFASTPGVPTGPK